MSLDLANEIDRILVTNRLLYSTAANDAKKEELRQSRTSSVIVAALRSANLTVNEMGEILGAITERICATACGNYPENPELEETAHDLAEICEGFSAVQDKIEERKYETECQEKA